MARGTGGLFTNGRGLTVTLRSGLEFEMMGSVEEKSGKWMAQEEVAEWDGALPGDAREQVEAVMEEWTMGAEEVMQSILNMAMPQIWSQQPGRPN